MITGFVMKEMKDRLRLALETRRNTHSMENAAFHHEDVDSSTPWASRRNGPTTQKTRMKGEINLNFQRLLDKKKDKILCLAAIHKLSLGSVY